LTSVRHAQMRDADDVVRVLVDAFMDDPVSRWLLPQRPHRESALPGFFRILVHSALVTGQIEITDDGAAVALWQPVEASVDGTVDATPDEHLLEQVFGPVCGQEATRRLVYLNQAGAQRHPRQESHDHLQFIAVHPDYQGRGVGSALLRHRLAGLDAGRTPAYLEATSPRNAALYEAYGFRPAGSPIPLPDGPPLIPMWRAPVAQS
jgi:ribosomal protein S18 acetylase RimI-like enzyme